MQKRVIILLVGFVVAAVAVARADRPEPVAPRASLATLPMQLGDWSGVSEPPFNERELEVLRLNAYVVRTYSASGHLPVGLYIGFWQSQRQGSSIHSPQNCLPAAGWAPTSQSILKFPDPRMAGATAEANRYINQKGLDRILVAHVYRSP